MDAALLGPLAAPPASPVARAGEVAGAAAASDAPGFAAALADADQTLHDTPAPDAERSAHTEPAADKATESSPHANDPVTLTQQSLADMAAMLASLNAAPASAPAAANPATAPEAGTADIDAAAKDSTDAMVEGALPTSHVAADAQPNAVPLTPAQMTPGAGDTAAQAAPRRPTPKARSAEASVPERAGKPAARPNELAVSADTAATPASLRAADLRDGAAPPRDEARASLRPGAPPDAATAPAADSTTPTTSAASAPAAAASANTTSTATAAGATASLVASETAAPPTLAAATLSTAVQGVAPREPSTRSRVASAATPTAFAPRAAAITEPAGGDISAAAPRNESNSTGAAPPPFSWLSTPASPSISAQGNGLGGRVNNEPAFQAQLSAQLFSSDFAPALGVQLSTLTRNGIPEARLHLNPAELGPIAVQIELDGRTAQVVLSASHAETRLVLEQAMPQLASALRDAGFSMSGGGVFQQPQQREPRANDGATYSAGNGADNGLAPTTMTLARVQRGVVDVYA